MEKQELRRLAKIEERINQIASEDLGLKYDDVEWDIVGPQKFLEIMAYHLPTQISNWKYGREYEKKRTIYEQVHNGLPYEVVINSCPPRAYLMETNVFAIQALVMAHVIGHCAFFKMNKYFANSRKDILEIMSAANERFISYEKKFGIDAVEEIVDIGHALQLHSTPFENETEEIQRERIFKQEKIRRKPVLTEFSDISGSKTAHQQQKDIDYENHVLWQTLKNTTPPEPMSDILRYIVDHSTVLDDWQKDILEVLREEGRYFWPMMKTKLMNEGFATLTHEKIMEQLFHEKLLTEEEHGQYNYSNSLVKAQNRADINPYLIGSEMFRDIEKRWDRGQHGKEYRELESRAERDNWNTNDGKGFQKCKDVVESYIDWFFIQDFLTIDLIDSMDLYIYVPVDKGTHIDYVRTEHTLEQIRNIVINSYAHNFIPDVVVADGNLHESGTMFLVHKHTGIELDIQYAKKTLEHIYKAWKHPVILATKYNDVGHVIICNKDGQKLIQSDDIYEDVKKYGI